MERHAQAEDGLAPCCPRGGPFRREVQGEETTVQQVKIFKTVENEIAALEAEVNAWIRQSGARVLSVTGNIAPQSAARGSGGGLTQGSFAPSDVVLIVLYET